MRTRHARRIRFAIRMAREYYDAWPDDYSVRAAEFLFPSANPFCRLENEAFIRTYRWLVWTAL